MKTRHQLIACSTSALFAAVLGLQAQSAQPPPRIPPPPIPPDDTAPAAPADTATDRRSATPSSSGSNSTSSNDSLRGASSEYGAQNAITHRSDPAGTASTQVEAGATALVQQIDQQGPAILDRAATQFATATCTADNARMLIAALHSGNAVTLTSDRGESATFAPNGRLGYGEAYLAMSLAVETLRQHGITGCATPEQWRSVLIGGPLSGTARTSAVSSATASARSTASFPGILVLRQQGQGWGQIAQTANVQLGTVVTSAQAALNLSNSTGPRSGLSSPTGEMDASKSATEPKAPDRDQQDDKTHPDKKDSEPDKEEPNRS